MLVILIVTHVIIHLNRIFLEKLAKPQLLNKSSVYCEEPHFLSRSQNPAIELCFEPAKSHPLARTPFVEYPFQFERIFLPIDVTVVLFP